MSGLDKDRKRNQTVCFRMTPEERRELEARIIVSGLPKGNYFIQSVLHQEVKIAVGKYQSDRCRRRRTASPSSSSAVSEQEPCMCCVAASSAKGWRMPGSGRG